MRSAFPYRLRALDDPPALAEYQDNSIARMRWHAVIRKPLSGASADAVVINRCGSRSVSGIGLNSSVSTPRCITEIADRSTLKSSLISSPRRRKPYDRLQLGCHTFLHAQKAVPTMNQKPHVPTWLSGKGYSIIFCDGMVNRGHQGQPRCCKLRIPSAIVWLS